MWKWSRHDLQIVMTSSKWSSCSSLVPRSLSASRQRLRPQAAVTQPSLSLLFTHPLPDLPPPLPHRPASVATCRRRADGASVTSSGERRGGLCALRLTAGCREASMKSGISLSDVRQPCGRILKASGITGPTSALSRRQPPRYYLANLRAITSPTSALCLGESVPASGVVLGGGASSSAPAARVSQRERRHALGLPRAPAQAVCRLPVAAGAVPGDWPLLFKITSIKSASPAQPGGARASERRLSHTASFRSPTSPPPSEPS